MIHVTLRKRSNVIGEAILCEHFLKQNRTETNFQTILCELTQLHSAYYVPTLKKCYRLGVLYLLCTHKLNVMKMLFIFKDTCLLFVSFLKQQSTMD